MAFRASPTVLIAEDSRLIALCYEDVVTDAGLSVGCRSGSGWNLKVA
jgi:hypothetical protein